MYSGDCITTGYNCTRRLQFRSQSSWDIVSSAEPNFDTPSNVLSYLNQLFTISKQFSGIDLNNCRYGQYVMGFGHEAAHTLTVLTTSTRAPVFVDGPREDAKQNENSTIQELDPTMSADKTINLPTATPGAYLSISPLSRTALPTTPTTGIQAFTNGVGDTQLVSYRSWSWRMTFVGGLLAHLLLLFCY